MADYDYDVLPRPWREPGWSPFDEVDRERRRLAGMLRTIADRLDTVPAADAVEPVTVLGHAIEQLERTAALVWRRAD